MAAICVVCIFMLHVSMCVCVHMYVSVCVHICAAILDKWGKVHVICVWTPEVDIMCLLLHSIYFFETEGLCFETES